MSKTIPFILAIFLAVGCDDSTTDTPKDDVKVNTSDIAVTTSDIGVTPQEDGEVTSEPASAAFAGLEGGAELKGEASIEMEIKGEPTKVELLSNGQVVVTASAAPFEIKWDTTTAEDGIAKLSLKAYDANGDNTSDELLALVLNNAEEVVFDDGSGSDTMSIIDLLADNHHKFHWTMPVGVKKVIGIANWVNPDWTFQVALGTGVCPHNGTPAGDETADVTPVAHEFAATSGTIPSGTIWYIHMGCMNEPEVVGSESAYTYKVFLVK